MDESQVHSKGSVTVVVRVRGQNSKEIGAHIVTKVIDEKVIIFDPKLVSSPEYHQGRKRKFRDLNKRQNKNAMFQFDRVFDETCSSVDVFENATKNVVVDVLNGYNACVFAYGATGAGKTFTMLGTAEYPGVIFLSVMSLYEQIDHITDKTYEIAVSYLEVYNEQIGDLLVPGVPLAVREDERGDVVVAGLSLHKINSAVELLHMLEFGNKNRTQHPTDANAESSRSHAVFQVYVRQRDRIANTTANIKVGKLSLVDLAGSERATVTTNRGARFREGANINRSLLSLGNCINALADGKSKGYVPYRNSKLTRLLKDSLGGNCRTVMIAAISPSTLSYEDTYNTLRYANRAKEIKVDMKQNSLSVEYHISQYPKMIQELRNQVAELKAKLSEQDKAVTTVSSNNIVSQICNTKEDEFKETIHKIFDNRVSIRKELLELEGSQRVLSLKILKKEVTLSRLSLLVDESVHDKTISELQRSISAIRQRLNKIISRKLALEQRMKENAAELSGVECEYQQALPVSSVSIQQLLQCRHMEVDLRDSRQSVKYLKKISRIQQRETLASEKLISALLRYVRRNHYVLKGHGLTTTETDNEFTSLQRLLRISSEVAWEDSSEAQGRVNECNGVSFEQLLQFPTLGYKLTPPCSVTNSQQNEVPSFSSSTQKQPSCSSATCMSSTTCHQPVHVPMADDASDAEGMAEDGALNSTFTLTSSPKFYHKKETHSQITSQSSSPPFPPVFVGKLTFAEAVKSPLSTTVRSPLKPCGNTIVSEASILTHKKQVEVTKASNTCSANTDRSSRPLSDTCTIAKPSYMQTTRAFSHRLLQTARPQTDDSIKRMRLQPPGRVPIVRPVSRPSRIRSVSADVRLGQFKTSIHPRKGIMF